MTVELRGFETAAVYVYGCVCVAACRDIIPNIGSAEATVAEVEAASSKPRELEHTLNISTDRLITWRPPDRTDELTIST